MSVKGNEYFPALTGVRAIAAYFVFIHHYHIIPKGLVGLQVFNFLEELHVGVTLFFVLSGFLIAFRYYDAETFSFKRYMMNRVARIYPIYLLLTTFTFLFYALTAGQNTLSDLGVYFTNITFIRGYFDDLKFTGIPQGWSLTVEETFYLLAPVIFILLRKHWVHYVTIPFVLIATGVGLVFAFRDVDFYGFFGSFHFMFCYTFLSRCIEFIIGIAVAVFLKKTDFKIRVKNITYYGLAAIIACVALISYLRVGPKSGMEHPLGVVINTFFLPLLGIGTFYYGLLTEKTIVSKILSTKVMVLLGKSSYIFYLIHMGVIAYLAAKIINHSAFIFVVVNIVSIILFTLVEEPLNHYIRKKYAAPKVAAS